MNMKFNMNNSNHIYIYDHIYIHRYIIQKATLAEKK